MEFVELGRTKEKVSRIGLGTWQFSNSWGLTIYDSAKEIISSSIEMGINLINTAMVYGNGMSERFIGRALEELGIERSSVFVVTKIPGQFLSYDDVFKAVDRSLERLRFDYIDALLAHWPPAWHNHPTCEYMKAFERLVELGKVRYLGLSDYPIELAESARYCLSKNDIQILEARYNIVERQAEKEIIPYVESSGLSMLAWSPLAKAAVLAKYSLEEVSNFSDVRKDDAVYYPDNYKQILVLAEAIKEVAEKYNKKPSQVALNWLIMYSKNVIPIPGAKNRDQAIENAGSVGWRMDYRYWRKLDEISRSIKLSYVNF
ncbi:MAG: aldo/keto reductase [Caldisphaeraceae archaeon]|nr:aldo/keto reductase [Caldisphaeraceae archaeon]MEB2793417.1 aldo/keto reductase [Caldisphaeraceae archaeon]MEB3691647.1 aldo/keto reductase [Caldisphaeraceae archaeon]MEB3798036.1 aldo/keto reductase [Caldisphaeraceae archaeon]